MGLEDKGARPSRTRDWRPWLCLPRPFWAASSSDARLRCTAPPPRTPTLLASTPLAPLPPCPPHLHAHFSSRTHHESAAAPSCLFWLVPDACFHTGATSAARSQAMLAGLVPLCNWGRSHIRPTQRQSHARHSTNRSLRHSAKHMPATAPSICSSQRPPLHTPALNTRRVGHTRHSARGK